MTITLLRDGEFIEVSPEDLKSGLKVEDKGRYFLFSMPGKDDVVLGSDITMPYNPPLRGLKRAERSIFSVSATALRPMPWSIFRGC